MSPPLIEHVLNGLHDRRPIDVPVAVVVAHPDDETIGAGASLHLFRHLMLVHVTDGAPRSLDDARAAGFENAAEYAAARRRELAAAMQVGDVHAGPLPSLPDLPVPDQAATLHLAILVATLRGALRDVAVVLTHPYEGGHPDHDAVAFAVQAAGRPRIEMAGYHATAEGGLRVGRFLDDEGLVVPLTSEERMRREAMLDCFATQHRTLEAFRGARAERFRPAPEYDFSRPPAPRAYYDGFPWGMTSERWCAHATEALACTRS